MIIAEYVNHVPRRHIQYIDILPKKGYLKSTDDLETYLNRVFLPYPLISIQEIPHGEISQDMRAVPLTEQFHFCREISKHGTKARAKSHSKSHP
jgi:hypothetical protein